MPLLLILNDVINLNISIKYNDYHTDKTFFSENSLLPVLAYTDLFAQPTGALPLVIRWGPHRAPCPREFFRFFSGCHLHACDTDWCKVPRR